MKTIVTFISLVLFIALIPDLVNANKTDLTISVPEKVKIGDEVKITLNISHSGNNIFHHTSWVYLKINGKEIKRWEYGMFSLPDGSEFKLEYKIKVVDKMDIEAEGNCNLHGSKGIKKLSVIVIS